MADKVSLLKLNDDCMFAVFSWLPILDLCAVRNSCSRLKNLTEDYFGRTYESLDNDKDKIKSDWDSVEFYEMQQVLSAFGGRIKELTVNSEGFPDDDDADEADWLRLVNAFCTRHSSSLKRLKLLHLSFDSGVLSGFRHPFGNVEELTLEKCTSDEMEIEKIVRKCKKLKYLTLNWNGSIDEMCIAKAFPMLRGFSIRSRTIKNMEAMEIFIAKNNQLTTFEIAVCRYVDDLLESIFEHLSELEKFTFRSYSSFTFGNDRDELMDIVKLEKLRALDIDMDQSDSVELLDALATTNQLTSLGLSDVPATDEICAAIAKMTNLQKLKLVALGNSDMCDLFGLTAASLTNLTEFYVSKCENVTFDDLVEFVANAPNLENLMVDSCYNIMSIDDEQFIRLAEVCTNRPGNQPLIFHYDEFGEVEVHDETKRKYSRFIRIEELEAERKDFSYEADCYDLLPNEFGSEEDSDLNYDDDDDEDDDEDEDDDDYDEDDEDDDDEDEDDEDDE